MESITCSLLDRMGARLSELTSGGGWSMPPAELTDLLAASHRLVAQAEALRLAVIRQADLRELAKAADATNTANWLAGSLRMNPRDATGLVKLAGHLDRDLPATAQALAAGDISVAHAQAISHTIGNLPREANTPAVRAEVDKTLVEQAHTFSPITVRRLGNRVLESIDPELADRILGDKLAKEEADAAKERTLRIVPTERNLFLIRGKIDAFTAELLRTLLDPLAKPHPTEEGRDERTADQRDGDAFAELVRLTHDCNLVPRHGGTKTQLVVILPSDGINPETGTGVGQTLRDGLDLSPELVARLMCESERAFLLQDKDKPGHVYLTDPKRLFTGKLRRALQARDRGCAFPGCDRPPSWCHAHHITSWSKGGPTSLSNGVLLCGHHHRVIHQGNWQVQLAKDGKPEFIPPAYVSLARQPIRNTVRQS